MNTIHPSAVVGPGVELGEGNVVGPNVVLLGPLRVGDGNWFGPGVVVGTPPEIRGAAHGAGWDAPAGEGVVIGDRNVLREGVSVQQGSHRATRIGDDCFLMSRVYVAHDDEIGDRATVAAGTTLAGHVRVGAGANLGMGAAVHQRRVVGPGAMVGMGAVVTRDVPPFAKAFGSPVRLVGVNTVGLQRSGADEGTVAAIVGAYGEGRLPQPGLADEAAAAAFLWWDDAAAEKSLLG
ncbi:DapH/DapD/GlmU-related protein [Cellulomonas sp.]|uniref:DapH/DapD/GlmU-related protein n=1 Tax=Cellulomonas sp. TaxID=40001 RepID=UPI002D23039F|nr:DapH/DapD/GlmU-related protein [Cellulomonas sp.]HYQ74701.1 DapH/DapD/GlmU-related protein [Cellulomonas sp.]